MIKVIIYGSNGKMGQVLSKVIAGERDMKVVAGIDRSIYKEDNSYPVYSDIKECNEEADVIIDFSHVSNLHKVLELSLYSKTPLIIATTGLSEKDHSSMEEASKQIPILYSANMSLGINALKTALKEISPVLGEDFDIEIIEKHHNKKIDAPSGTAYLLANIINESMGNSKSFIYGREGGSAKRQENEIGIHAVRGGTIPGEHTVIFAGMDEIIEIKHTALSKNIFAMGAVKAARFIIKAQPGLYNMSDIF
jgi:4-hydroxy-tetrahydrodipicolinate reductase